MRRVCIQVRRMDLLCVRILMCRGRGLRRRRRICRLLRGLINGFERINLRGTAKMPTHLKVETVYIRLGGNVSKL